MKRTRGSPWALGVLVTAAAIVAGWALLVPAADWLATHDVGQVAGSLRTLRLQTARDAARGRLLTLGAGLFALGALVFTARNYGLSREGQAHDRSRVLNERFIAVAAQLGDDKAAVRLAGVHAMAGLADDWEENRQTCIDVLCAYLRMPYEPEPPDDVPAQERLAFRGGREVRHTVIRVVTAHLRDNAPVSWQGMNFDFTGVVFDGGDFTGVVFSGGTVNFDEAVFSGGSVSFGDAQFSGGVVSFDEVVFSGGVVSFIDAVFSGSRVSFLRAVFSGSGVYLMGARFSGGRVTFAGAWFSGGVVTFAAARFSGSEVSFTPARDWSHPPTFPWVGAPPVGVKLPAAAPGSEAQ